MECWISIIRVGVSIWQFKVRYDTNLRYGNGSGHVFLLIFPALGLFTAREQTPYVRLANA